MLTTPDWAKIVDDIRRDKGVSQRQLARASGLGRSTIRRILVYGGTPRVDDLDRILNVLGYELDVHPVLQGRRPCQ